MLPIRLKENNMYRIGFTSVTFRKLSREEICIAANENGIEYIEWGGDVHLPPDDEKALEEVICLQNKYGIKAISYGSYYRVGQRDFELFKRILTVAQKIGCKRIRLWLGEASRAETDSVLFNLLKSETQKLCDMAKEKDITLSFEFHEGTLNDNGKSSLEFLKAVNRDNIATYWQPLRTKNDFENLKAVAPHVNGVHVFHWKKSGIRCRLCEGADDWKKYIDYLKNNSPDEDYILEFVKGDSLEQFREDAEILKTFLTQIYGTT